VSAEGSDAGGRRTAAIEGAYGEDVSFSDRVQKSHANREGAPPPTRVRVATTASTRAGRVRRRRAARLSGGTGPKATGVVRSGSRR
jgi:hypothetical protein